MEPDELFPSRSQSPFLWSYIREAFSGERCLTPGGQGWRVVPKPGENKERREVERIWLGDFLFFVFP